MADVKNIKVDRMRYTKNKLSSTLAYVAIIFNVLYFVSIYSSNIGNYYYNMSMGLSVLCNLVFLLAAFLCSEGIKNYNIGYAYFLIILSVVQVARIFGIPKRAHGTIITLVEEEVKVMTDKQFTYVVVCLLISAAACLIAGIVGIVKTVVLEKYKKDNGLN